MRLTQSGSRHWGRSELRTWFQLEASTLSSNPNHYEVEKSYRFSLFIHHNSHAAPCNGHRWTFSVYNPFILLSAPFFDVPWLCRVPSRIGGPRICQPGTSHQKLENRLWSKTRTEDRVLVRSEAKCMFLFHVPNNVCCAPAVSNNVRSRYRLTQWKASGERP